MKLLDLFSGIGGFSLAASWTGVIEPVLFCEIDPFCKKILSKHWPNVPIHDDIRTLKGSDIEPIDIVSGGFPCQPFSIAGKQEGTGDDRHLWPEMFRIIQETRPTWIIGENVAGIIRLGLDKVLSDLEGADYQTEVFIIPACAVDAPHRRDRVWIVSKHDGNGSHPSEQREFRAHHESGQTGGNDSETRGSSTSDVAHSNRGRCEQRNEKQRGVPIPNKGSENVAHPGGPRLEARVGGDITGGEVVPSGRTVERGRFWLPEPLLGRVAHGVPNRVDRLRSLGNAIVPQVAYQIFKVIAEVGDE